MNVPNHNAQSHAKPLQRWGVIVVEGDDAGAFLQSQLTHHIQDLTPNVLQMAGFCTAKGRLLGNFWVLRTPSMSKPTFWLLCRADIMPALVKRLSMFVLRSKCKVSDGRQNVHVLFERNNVNIDFKNDCQNNSLCSNITWNTQNDDTHHATIVLSSVSSITSIHGESQHEQPYALHLVSHVGANSTPSTIEANPADDAFEAYWTKQGLAFIEAQTVERFTPQAINFDLVGGVSFNKGCYPGQEVVARTHYLGKIKRRAVLCEVIQAEPDASLFLGRLACKDVWASTQNHEPAGQIVQVACDGTRCWALVELPLELLTQTVDWFVKAEETPSGVVCKLSPKSEWMPYSIHEKGNAFDSNISKI